MIVKTQFGTRNLWMGVLVGLVLMFGVQGIAEAISKPTIAAATLTPDHAPAVHKVGISTTIATIAITPDKTGTKETVRISKSSGIAFTGIFRGLSSVTLTEDEDTTLATPTNGSNFTYTDSRRITQTLTGTSTGDIAIRFTAKGRQTVTISGRDYEGEGIGNWSYTYTYYVIGPGSETTTISLVGLSNGYRTGIFAGAQIPIHNGDSGHYDVTYTTSPADAMGQVEKPDGTLAAEEALNAKQTSSAFDVELEVSKTYQVTAKVEGSKRETVGVYIVGTPTLTVGHPGDDDGDPDTANTGVLGGKDNPGLINQQLPAHASPTNRAFTAFVKDGLATPGNVPGVVVKFQVRGSGDAGGYLVFGTSNAGTLVDSNNRKRLKADGTALTTATEKILYVRTNASGQADVDFQLGTDGKQDVTITAVGLSKVVSAYAGAAGKRLVDPQSRSSSVSGRIGDYELRVKAEDEDGPLSGETVQFVTGDGTLDDPKAPAPSSTKIVTTDTQGIAFVFFDPNDNSGSPRATAQLLDLGDDDAIGGTGDDADQVIDTVVFNVRGGSSGGSTDPPRSTVNLSASSLTGPPGAQRTITVEPSTAAINFAGSVTGSGQTRTVTLPSTTGSHDLTATATGYNPGRITFVVTSPDTDGDAGTQATGGRRLSLVVTGSGSRRVVTVTALTAQGGNIPGLDVTLSGAGLSPSRTIRVGTPTSLVLTSGTLVASATGFASDSETITVQGSSTLPGTSGQGALTVSKDGAQVGTRQAILVRATPVPNSNVTFTVTRGGANVGAGIILTTGTGQTTVIVPTTGIYFLTVSADGYRSVQQRFTAGVQATDTQDTMDADAPEPSSIEISGSATHTGTVNTELDSMLRVRVLDADENGVPDVRVIFRVRTGQGRLSQRGNGRAIGTQTNRQGYATAQYTPISARSTVSASANGLSEGVTFTITTGAATTGTDTPASTGVTPTPPVSPVVNTSVAEASRPPMLWISGGKIYALVGADVKEFIAGVENAISLAVGEDKLYWTEETSETKGTLNSANLDGSGAKELRDLWGVPRGIAVDGEKLYWTDAQNRLQSANLDGTGIRNVFRNLSDPMDLAVSGDKVYWIQDGDGDSLFSVNLSDPKQTTSIDSTLGSFGGVTIAGSKVYWTEKISETEGMLHVANLDGTGAKALRSEPLWGAPVGIAVDTARSNLYWTDAVGRLQRSKLDATGIHNVVKGLGMPSDMVISNSITAPAGTPSKTTSTTASNKYDVDGSGTVDSKDVDALLLAVAAGSTDAKYDVDGNGKVDIFDLIDLRGQIPATASAPTLLGTKLGSIAVDRLQEQIDLLVASGDRSPEVLKTLIYLQQLIVMARPEKTQLLANYPNPFNPETWIPYELATDTNVKITIYNAQGVVIRTLQFGQQSAGYYTDRERAAYWDGRNTLGEQVASGIYFYQLETDDMSTLRKMVILK